MPKTIACPRCGGQYLHHVGVTVFDRAEDAEASVTHIPVRHERVAKVSAAAHNPSARRGGIVITMNCETCSDADGLLELTIAQHKGSTLIGWQY